MSGVGANSVKRYRVPRWCVPVQYSVECSGCSVVLVQGGGDISTPSQSEHGVRGRRSIAKVQRKARKTGKRRGGGKRKREKAGAGRPVK